MISTFSRQIRRWWKRTLLVALGLPIGAWLVFNGAVAWWAYPVGIDQPRAVGTLIEDRNGVPLAALVAGDDQWHLPLSHDQISPHLLGAMVAVEDGRFFAHAGVDWKSAAGALWQDIAHFGIRRGGSTLTMQLQRLRDPKPRTLFNKFEQAVRSEQLEKRSTKDSILVEYLNRAPFGSNLVGAGAASWRYFGRPCRDLSLGEAALLAGLPQSPNRLRPDRHPEAATARRNHVLHRMLACGMIDQKQHDEATAEPSAARWLDLPQDVERGVLPTLHGLASGYPGGIVVSTIDREIQERAAALAGQQVRSLHASGVTAAAVVVVDTPTGEVLAAVSYEWIPPSSGTPGEGWGGGSAIEDGGSKMEDGAIPLPSSILHSPSSLASIPNAIPRPEYRRRERSGVDLTRSPRSTGSTLKPFIYAAAFDAGICTPTTMLLDSPAAWPGYRPGNYDRAFCGPMPAADALAESRNIPALVLLGQVGVERAVGVMNAFGLETIAHGRRDFGLTLAIGGAEATPIEMAEAYATLARGGLWRKATLVKNDAGIEHRVMRADPCWQAIHAISQRERTANVCAEAAALDVAWKTGTSSGHRDAWCAAVTPRRTVVVWLGNPKGEGSTALVGQEAAAPLALQLIASLDSGGPGWPAVREVKAATPTRLVAAKSHTAFTIVSPTRGQRILLSPDLAAERQQVSLEVSVAEQNIWWFVDDDPVGRDRQIWWSPAPGTHQIRAVDSEGRSAEATVQVQAGRD